MTSPTEAARYAKATSLFVPVDIVPLVGSPDPLERPLRGIRVGTGGTVAVITGAGNERTLTFVDGETRFCVITHVLAMTAGEAEGLV